MDEYRSSYAVDKNGVDQAVAGSTSVLITATRVLWDLNGDFNLDTSSFLTPIDGIWNGNGTIKIHNPVNCTKASIEIWRNGELWFTVAERDVSNTDTVVSLVYSCDMDCYYSNNHSFDLRLRMDGIDPSCTISGNEDDTAWGASFRFCLYRVPPS